MRFSKGTIENFIFGNFPEAKYVSGSKDEIHFNTPFDIDKKRRLYVSSNTGKWFDQKAQRGGNRFEYFVSEYLDVPVGEAISILNKEYKDEDYVPIVEEKVVVNETPLEVPEGVKFFNTEDEIGIVGNQALGYLNNRKINSSGLGYISSEKPEFDKRVFIPFYENNKLVYYIARSFIPSEELRYKNPKNLSAGDYVFNYDKIREEVFIFEGVFDALSLNFPQVGTAMLSSSLKDEQAKKLISKGVNRVILVPDNDDNPSTKITILENLIKTKNKLTENKKYKQSLSIFVYNIPEKYKDFNDYKVSTGNGNIPISECRLFDEMEIIEEILKLKIRGG